MTQHNDHVIKWAVANYKAAEAKYRKMEAGMKRAMDMEQQYLTAARNAFHADIMVLFNDARRRHRRWERMVGCWGNRVTIAQRQMKRCYTMVTTAFFQ